MDKLEWYFVDANGEQAGPLVGNDFIAAFASKAFDESSLCWNETLDEWSPVSSIPGLLTYLKPAPKAPAGRPGPKAPPARSPSVPTSAAEPVAATPSSPKASTGPKKESKLVSALDKANQIAMQRGGWKEMKTADGGEYYLNIVTEEVTWDKPRELETVAEQAREGDWYWLPDPVEAFIPGKKVNTTKDKVQFEKEHGGFVYLSLNEAKSLERMQWSQLKTKTNDLVMLDVMNPPLIMYNLKMRFQENEIYTNVGTILISCNPYKRLPLYTPQVLDSYMKKGSRKMPPHVYNIADDAFRNLREWSQAQSIVISGESGAGKTECTKQALEYLAEIAGSGTSSVEQKLLSSNPILEAFGNAKTVRNNNSSRFGKYVEIYFNNRNQIAGASVTNYLLEKIRVCMQSPGERNYHIFFQLILGASEDTKRNLRLTDASRFFYLNQSGSTEVDGVDDVNDFADMDNAMNVMGFTAAEKDQVFKCTACVLHIGNIEFKSAGDRKCEVKNSAVLRDVAALMQVLPRAIYKDRIEIGSHERTDRLTDTRQTADDSNHI
jgi:myosin heavy subunit